jgi:hypothetical protein
VLVAPGMRAPVTEVVELESESLIEAAPSVPPPAAPAAEGGFLLDPFAASASLREPPAGPAGAAAVAPAPAFPPPAAVPVASAAPAAPVDVDVHIDATTEEPVPPSVTGAPHFAAAIDLPPPSAVVQHPWPAPQEPARERVESSSQEPDEEAYTRAAADARRRKTIVLGGVGLLGLIVFVLAGVRLAQRGSDAPPAMGATAAGTTTTATASPPPATTPAASAASGPAATQPPAAAATTTAPVKTAPPAAAPPARTPPPAAVPPAAKPPPFAAAPPRAAPAAAPAARPAAAPRPRPKPTFDPNSL